MSYDLEESSSQRITFTPNTTSYSTTMSLSFWLKLESLTGSHQEHFVDFGASTNWNPRNFGAYWSPGNNVGISWINSTGPTFSEWTVGFTPSTSAWEHWYFEVDWTTNPDTALLWINGVSKTLTNTFGTNNQTPTGTYGQLSIGGEHGSGTTGNYTDGLIAEVAIWSDIVGSSRASGLYNSGNGGRADTLYPSNLTEYIRLKADLSNFVGGTGTALNSPTLSADHPFSDASTVRALAALGVG